MLEPSSVAQTLGALNLRLARQVAPARWARVFDDMAGRIETGTPFDEAFRQCQARIPRELRGLIQEALRTPEPGTLLAESVRVRAEVQRTWREFTATIVYPLVLLGFALVVGIAFSFSMKTMVSYEWMEDFGIVGTEQLAANLDDQHHAVVGLGMILGWLALVLVSLYWLGPPWAWLAVLGGMLIVGKPLRWLSLQELLVRLQIFISQGQPTSEAAHAVARSFAGSPQAVSATAIANRIEAGAPIGQAIATSMLTDGLCRPAVLALDQTQGEIVPALLLTSDLLGDLVEQRCRTLRSILPVIVLALVGTVLWSSLSVYVMALIPLIDTISDLS